ncbi:MAG: LysR family transcriptional regulator [Peptococcaceae bacterium]|nr:LysR family transcriptional regulator [Peptococcaceae bacterium]
MRLNQFRFLAALKKYGTISRAAQQLYISQPSLSAAIRELEEELGFEVVKRTRKGVIFTAQGEQVLEHSQNILREIESIEQLSSTFGMRFKGTLAVGCVPYIYHSIILDTLMEMKKKYPKTITRLQEDSSYALVELVHQRELDLGVIMMSNIEQANWGTSFQKYQLEYQKLFDDQMYFWVGQSHPLYKQQSVRMADALQYPFITYRNVLNDFNRNMLLEYNKELDIIQIDDRESLYRYLRKSQAITVMPMCTLQQDNNYMDGLVKPLKIVEFEWTTQVGLIYLKDEPLSMEQKEFAAMLLQKIPYHNQ